MYSQSLVVELLLQVVSNGIANTGDAVEIIGMGAEKLTSTITGVEMCSVKSLIEVGDNVGIL
jgi:elongation factor Tu